MASANSGPITKFFVWAIIAMLIVGLGGFGLSNFGGSSQAVVTAGTRSVTVQEYYNAVRQELNQFAAATQQPATLSSANEIFQQAYGQTLDQRVLERLTLEAALDNEAANMGISVGDIQVRDQLIATAAFQGISGSFDEDAYKETLSRNNLNTRDYEASLRDQIARTLVQAAMVSGISVNDTQVDAMLGFAAQRRDVSWFRLNADDLPAPLPTPDESDLIAYHEANAEADFTTPRTKNITFIQLTPAMLLDSVEVDEDTLRALYEERSSEFVVPERRLVERLTFSNEEEAQTASERVTSGEITFDALVEERGLDLADLDLGDVAETELETETAAAVFALEGPAVTGVLPGKFGPALFRMNGILQGRVTSFEDARALLQQDIVADRARRRIEDEATHIDDLLAGGATLEEVAAETDMEAGTISWADGNGDGIAAYVGFRDAAQAVTEDDFPEVVNLEDGGIVALRLDGFTDPYVLPLEDVREKVINGWQAHETDNQLAEVANTLSAQLALGVSPEDLGLELMREENLTRGAYLDGTPADMVASVFEMDAGSFETLTEFGSTFLVQLNEIKDPDLTDANTIAMKDAIRTGLSQGISQDAYSAWAIDRLNAAGTTRDQAAITGLLTQIP
ncbi:SurA N-terminal domain-containing protein [Halocynthiibacter sp.]|uniref:SurA N-terminal domain-containing protein n=1 Tax=Halocynthiibacter sp. TaxID=1979210 RepID=UPI003C3DDC2C